MKLKSGVLYYVVFIMLISWIICVSILLISRLNNIVFNDALIRNNLQDDLKSAVNIICANPEMIKKSDSITFKVPNNGASEIIVKKKLWGFFTVLNVNAIRGKKEVAKNFYAGNDLNYQEPISLYMADENKYLSVCGNTLLNGNCYLPKLGVKRGYIEGSTYKGKTIVFGQTKVSKRSLPQLDKSAVGLILKFLRDFRPDTFAEIHTLNEFNSKYKHANSFSNKTIAFFSEKALSIDNKTLDGNIMVCSSKFIKISKSNKINNIIAIAPKIIISEGFKGNLQCIATDSLVVQRRCTLTYPSVIAVLSENISNEYLKIEEKTRIDGALIIDQYAEAASKPILLIMKDSEIYGQTYCNGVVNTKGDFYGSLYCRNFILNTNSAIYENHLLHTKMDRKKLSEYFCGIAVTDSMKMRYGIIKELN